MIEYRVNGVELTDVMEFGVRKGINPVNEGIFVTE